MPILIVSLGGALGAACRYLTYIWIRSRTNHHFPLGTLLVNILGCFAVGALMVMIEKSVPYHRHILLLGVTGFLGSYTTFSAFGFETLHLIRTNQIGWAFLNVLANVCIGLGAVWVGRIVGSGITQF